jgi:biopolymer transport protein ExbD
MHGGEEASEPNMTPLLDLVLQLVMFFMMCANFLMEESNQEVVLPVAQMAKPPDSKETSLVFLNVDKEGKVLVSGRNPMNLAAAKTFLSGEYSDAKRRSPNKQVPTLIILRAHKDTTFAKVFDVMSVCKSVGFTRMQLRAIQKGSKG